MSLRGQELVGPVDILRKSQFLNPSENALQQHFWKDASSGPSTRAYALAQDDSFISLSYLIKT